MKKYCIWATTQPSHAHHSSKERTFKLNWPLAKSEVIACNAEHLAVHIPSSLLLQYTLQVDGAHPGLPLPALGGLGPPPRAADQQARGGQGLHQGALLRPDHQANQPRRPHTVGRNLPGGDTNPLFKSIFLGEFKRFLVTVGHAKV